MRQVEAQFRNRQPRTERSKNGRYCREPIARRFSTLAGLFEFKNQSGIQ